ncbi:AzlC family ABC transporter permease [Rhodoferax aquaticus]|uniref:Branched-chain amino acid ABC transporter permease n=1 Tax=Rhodoferax aquaticus TaxID=2527691 RepID=A0A515EK64_9BURK|nr:AzlC family ABC transporter permease [Rhodoferax aquaticus]QDL53054.1 branched-chain amino acid ABC transporter permease [Rhodoferax aquaticus]
MFFQARNYRHPAFKRGFLDMLSVAPGIAAWGLMTGVAMVKSGMSTAEALLMALIVFAGSSQLAAIPLLLAGAPMWVVLATAFCVNLRFVVFSAHMRPYMMHLPLWQRLVNGYLTGDLTYVLFVKHFPSPASTPAQQAEQMAYLAGNGGINWLSWTSFSVLGVVLANFIPATWGLGFAGILALVGMLCSLASNRMRWISAGAAAVVGVAAYGLPLKLNILLAIAVAVALCLKLEPPALVTPLSGPAKKETP